MNLPCVWLALQEFKINYNVVESNQTGFFLIQKLNRKGLVNCNFKKTPVGIIGLKGSGLEP